jgi:predicted Zn-dependent protease
VTHASRRGLTLALAVVAAGALHCGPTAIPSSQRFRPTRFDYDAFRNQLPADADKASKDGTRFDAEAIREPNYLPFMGQRFQLRDKEEDLIVFCRWDVTRFPLRVYVQPPVLDPALQEQFDASKEPNAFTEAAWRALESWQTALGGVVSFRRVRSDDAADLRIFLVGQVGPAPEEGVQVLGTTAMRDACQVNKRSIWPDRMDVTFEVPEIRIYVADDHGLLPADQVERNVLHEIGHALGSHGHSPIPADLMYEVARDRRVDRLSPEDVNSFRTLYRLPNGTIYARLPRGGDLPRAAAAAPPGPVQLAPQLYSDPRLGFTVRPGLHWRMVASPRGVVVIDGVAWDYEASFQVVVRSYPTVANYLSRHAAAHVREGKVVQQGPLDVRGRRAHWMRILPVSGDMIEDHIFLESGDGRVVIVIMEAPTTLRQQFGPWFDAMLGSLEVTAVGAPAPPAN